jgi:hypothetical protein
MSLKQKAISRAEKAYDVPTGEKVTTVYVVTASYRSYRTFLGLDPVDPLQYRYLYDHKQLKRATSNLLPTSEVKVLFLPFWFKHPDSSNIFKVLSEGVDDSLLKPLYSDNIPAYVPVALRPGVH